MTREFSISMPACVAECMDERMPAEALKAWKPPGGEGLVGN